MWRKEIILILIILGLAYQMIFFDSASAQRNYLPKADLIKGSGPEVYLLENGIKRWIPDPETFNRFKYNWQNIKMISDSTLNKYSKGSTQERNKITKIFNEMLFQFAKNNDFHYLKIFDIMVDEDLNTIVPEWFIDDVHLKKKCIIENYIKQFNLML